MFRNRLYYAIKPLLPWSVRMGVRRWFAVRKRKRVGGIWPILPGSERPPTGWPGWPDGKKFAFVLTHDVEGPEGLAKIKQLAELEMSLGFRSSFNLIPEGPYAVPAELRAWLVQNGFEVGMHDLHHDGMLFASRADFPAKAGRINTHLRNWHAAGFRSGFMLRQFDWLHQLDIAYDATSFDTDPFEPQPEGVNTIFPFWVPRPLTSPTESPSPNSNLLSPTPPASAFAVSAFEQPPPPSTTSPSSSELRTPNSDSRFPLSAFAVSAFEQPPPPATTSPSDSELRTPNSDSTGYVELPYTLPQDSTLFLLLREPSPEIWLRKLDWVAAHGGMALVNVHPDYLRFPGEPERPNTFPVEFYRQLLEHVRTHYVAAPPSVAPSLDVGCSMLGVRCSDSPPPPTSDLCSLTSGNATPSPNSDLLSPTPLDVGRSMLGVRCPSQPSDSPSPNSCLPSSTPLAAAAWRALPRHVASFLRDLQPPLQHRRPLRVCMVTHSHYRSDNRVTRYAEALAARGDSVDVLSLRSHLDQPRRETLQGVNAVLLQDRFNKDETGPTHHLLRTIRFLLVAASWITRQHHRQPYDVFHIHNIPDFLVFATLYPRLRGAKVILDIHDIVPEFFASKFAEKPRPFAIAALRLMERWSARFAHHVIIANDLWREKYATRTGSNSKCTVFINNVNRALFSPSLRQHAVGSTGGPPVASGGPPNASTTRTIAHPDHSPRHPGVFPLIMFPGGLQWHQGLDIAIRAMPHVLQSFPNAEFHIYGDGNMKPAWVALVAELGLGHHVRFFPALPLREVVMHMANADLGVVPKRADSFGNEAYSTKIMEFMALGVPVVASSTKVDRFYFDDSVLKFFESGNVDALAAAIIEVLTDQEATRQRVQRASAYAEKHSWETRRHDYLKLVDDLCAAS